MTSMSSENRFGKVNSNTSMITMHTSRPKLWMYLQHHPSGQKKPQTKLTEIAATIDIQAWLSLSDLLSTHHPRHRLDTLTVKRAATGQTGPGPRWIGLDTVGIHKPQKSFVPKDPRWSEFAPRSRGSDNRLTDSDRALNKAETLQVLQC